MYIEQECWSTGRPNQIPGKRQIRRVVQEFRGTEEKNYLTVNPVLLHFTISAK